MIHTTSLVLSIIAFVAMVVGAVSLYLLASMLAILSGA